MGLVTKVGVGTEIVKGIVTGIVKSSFAVITNFTWDNTIVSFDATNRTWDEV